VRLEWLVSGEGSKNAGSVGGAQRVEASLLRLILEGVEEGLSSRRRRMPVAKKAELVARFYELFADEPGKAERGKVIALVKAAS